MLAISMLALLTVHASPVLFNRAFIYAFALTSFFFNTSLILRLANFTFSSLAKNFHTKECCCYGDLLAYRYAAFTLRKTIKSNIFLWGNEQAWLQITCGHLIHSLQPILYNPYIFLRSSILRYVANIYDIDIIQIYL